MLSTDGKMLGWFFDHHEDDFPGSCNMDLSDVIERLAQVSLYTSQYEYTKQSLSFTRLFACKKILR